MVRGNRAADTPQNQRFGRDTSRIVATAFGVLVLGLVILAYAAFTTYDVVAEGRLLDYTPGTIYKIEVFGVTFYVEKGATTPSLDVFNSWILIAISSMSLLVAVFYHFSRSSRSRAKWFFFLLFFGAGYLAADELLALHETLGHNLRFLRDLPGVERPDDAIIAFYVLPAAIFLFFFRDIFLGSRTARAFFALGFGLFVVTAVLDVLAIEQEDVLEPIASLCLFAGFVALAVDALLKAASEYAARARPT